MNLNGPDMPTEIPMQYLEEIITHMNLEKMNMLQVVQHVYRATYMKYSLKFFEAKAYSDKLEGKILEKNKAIEDLELKLVEMKEQLDAACQKNKELYEGTQVSTSGEEKTV